MINLAENLVLCDCGSPRLAPCAVNPGEPVICAACAAVHRLDVRLVPLPWSAVVAQLEEHDLQAFEWTRAGVPLAQRRTLLELEASGGRYRRAEWMGSVLGLLVVFAVPLVLLLLRSVLR